MESGISQKNNKLRAMFIPDSRVHVFLSQKLDSDSHFEILKVSVAKFVQQLC